MKSNVLWQVLLLLQKLLLKKMFSLSSSIMHPAWELQSPCIKRIVQKEDKKSEWGNVPFFLSIFQLLLLMEEEGN